MTREAYLESHLNLAIHSLTKSASKLLELADQADVIGMFTEHGYLSLVSAANLASAGAAQAKIVMLDFEDDDGPEPEEWDSYEGEDAANEPECDECDPYDHYVCEEHDERDEAADLHKIADDLMEMSNAGM
jgi:hypothetical protein